MLALHCSSRGRLFFVPNLRLMASSLSFAFTRSDAFVSSCFGRILVSVANFHTLIHTHTHPHTHDPALSLFLDEGTRPVGSAASPSGWLEAGCLSTIANGFDRSLTVQKIALGFIAPPS